MSHKLINSAESVVTEMLQGFVSSTPHASLLDGLPDIKVVFDRQHDHDKVAVISGGGSGHEPAHAGYIGKGMLSAAVCGDVFASPSAAAVLAAIRQTTGKAGCLLIVKNYTGDRLHFGLAAEQAKLEGYMVEMVVVGEDCAIDHPGLAGRRGLAGTALVHKIAGAAAESGMALHEVVALAHRAAGSMGTLGVSLGVCTLPGKAPEQRLAPGELELGLGIHGEPGAMKTAWQPVDQLVPLMLSRIVAYPPGALFAPGSGVVLVVNGLGGTPLMELYVVARAALKSLQQEHKVNVHRMFVGNLMTSLDMPGCSLTLMEADDAMLKLLDTPTAAPGWPSAAAALQPNTAARAPVPAGPPQEQAADGGRPEQLTEAARTLEAAIIAGAEALVALAPQLSEWDAKVGDGDCGDTMKQGATAVLTAVRSSCPLHNPAATAQHIAATLRRAIGATSGALYDVFFTASAQALRQAGATSGARPQDWAAALQAGTQAVRKYGGAAPGQRTMLDALQPALDALQHALANGASACTAAQQAAQAAAQGAEATARMVATAGRASYVRQDEAAGVPDPGAMAVAAWMQAAANSLANIS